MPASTVAAQQAASQPPRLLDVLREGARRIGHSEQTITCYERWVIGLIRYHSGRHHRALQAADIGCFLEHVGLSSSNALVAIEEARTALEFLYRSVLGLDLGELPRPRPPHLLGAAGPAEVTSPLDVLEQLSAEEVEAAVAATRWLRGTRPGIVPG
jgi:hypothetical protein